MNKALLVTVLLFLLSFPARSSHAQTANGATIQASETSLTLPTGNSTYLFGMATGGAYTSTGFAQGNYQSVVDADGYLSGALAITSSDADSFTTSAGYYVIGGVGVSDYTSMTQSYGVNAQSGASGTSDTFTVTENSLVVFIGLASSQQSISLSGITGLQVDAVSSEPIAMIIAQASLGPNTYTVTEQSSATATGQDPNHMTDLLGVFVFTGTVSQPTISSVSPILALSNTDPVITIEGTGFGSPTDCVPTYSTPCVGDRSYFELTDTTQKPQWNAGYIKPGSLTGGDTCDVSIYEWDNSEIVLQVHLSPLVVTTTCPIQIGDKLNIHVWNPALTSGSSTTKAVTAVGQVGIFVSLNVSGTIISGPYAVFSHNDTATLTNGVVAALNAQGVGISASDVGFTVVDNSFINVTGVAEVDDFLELPTDFINLFSSDVTLIDAGVQAGLGGAAELLPLDLAQQCLTPNYCLSSPPDFVASLANDILDVDQAYVEQAIDTYCPADYIIGPQSQYLLVDIDGLTVAPSQLGPINLPITWSYAQGLSSTACTAESGSSGALVAKAQPSGTVSLASPSTVSLASSANPIQPNQSVIYTATVTNNQNSGTITGTVTFKDGSTTSMVPLNASNGIFTATFSETYMKTGTHSVTATYSGDSNDGSSTSLPLLEYVENFPVSSSTTVATSGSPSVVTQSVTFTATVKSTYGAIPDGETVTFYDGSTQIATGTTTSGMASFSTSALAVKTHTIKATYAGDATFKTSSGTVQQIVNAFATATNLSANPNSSNYGQDVVLTAVVATNGSETPTGTVTFYDGGSSLGTGTLDSGTATLKTAKLPLGTDSLTATYNGDSLNAKSTSSVLMQTVNQAQITMTLTSSPNPSAYGKSVKFTATLTSNGSLPNGQSVSFSYGGTAFGTATISSAGIATFSTTTLPTGSDQVTATYSGSADYSSAGASVTQTVN